MGIKRPNSQLDSIELALNHFLFRLPGCWGISAEVAAASQRPLAIDRLPSIIYIHRFRVRQEASLLLIATSHIRLKLGHSHVPMVIRLTEKAASHYGSCIVIRTLVMGTLIIERCLYSLAYWFNRISHDKSFVMLTKGPNK